MGLSDSKSLKSYDDSVNLFVKNPWVFLPFMIGYFISVFMFPLIMLVIGGSDAYSYWFNSRFVIATPQVFSSVLIALFATVIISAFVISFFDAVGISGIAGVVTGGSASLKNSWRSGLKSWIGMIITSLTLVIIGFVLIYPILLMLSSGFDLVSYLSYAAIAAFFYSSLQFYSRIVTIVENKSGLEAIHRGIKLFYKHLGFSLVNALIIVIIYLAFSWFYFISSAVHLLATAIVLIPWINVFLTVAYFKLNPSVLIAESAPVSVPEVVIPQVIEPSVAKVRKARKTRKAVKRVVSKKSKRKSRK